jgi:iron complex outermembrane receptor protein
LAGQAPRASARAAQRRPQSLLDVNASVSAIDAATIRENDIQGVKDFFALVPNVNAQENGNGGPRSVTISMRGINDQGAGGERVAAVSAFAFYLDELSVGNAATDTANPPLYDIESIEVLRGPQGTYFGRNASGGAINIQTRKPGRKQYWQIDLGVGTHGSITSNGVLNAPDGAKAARSWRGPEYLSGWRRFRHRPGQRTHRFALATKPGPAA